MTDTHPPFTLRSLPLPAKLVVSAFLMAVGIGYFSALVQLHFQHTDKDGTAMPTPANVVAKFAGKTWVEAGAAEVPKSKLEHLIADANQRTGLNSSNMTPAFFVSDPAYKDELKAGRPKPVVDDERNNERRAVLAWAKADPGARQTAYEKDAFEVPAALAGNPFPKDHRIDDKTVKIKSILAARCGTCHGPGGEKAEIPLASYSDFDQRVLQVGAAAPPGGGWVSSGKQLDLVKLTQSTHAHLLSFSMLFSLTGLVFAFTSYPVLVRCVLAPLVVVFQFLDVGCWWLARLPESGPYFAMCIIGTGGVVGMGLAAQIVLSLFNMYDRKGKAALVGIFALGFGVLGLVGVMVVKPHLADEKAKADAEKAKAAAAKGDAPPKADDKKNEAVAVPDGPNWGQRLVAGKYEKGSKTWGGKTPGGMLRVFFDKDEGDFAEALKRNAPNLAALTAERETERALAEAWFALPDADRRKAYDADVLPLPPALAKAPLAKEFQTAGGAKVKSLLAARCVFCHGPDGEKSDAPLDTYTGLAKYFGAMPATTPPEKKGDE